LSSDARNPRERQQRKLQEMRRSFAEVAARIPALERAEPNANGDASGSPQLKTPVLAPSPSRPRPTWAVAAAVAVACLLVGGGLGYLLHSPAPSPEPVPAVITQTVVRPQTKVVVPGACLETARRGDQTVDLLLSNIRDRRLSSAVKAYATASQACRREASP
jgi:hypothetical protein